jgi:hypothetical protein
MIMNDGDWSRKGLLVQNCMILQFFRHRSHDKKDKTPA